MRLTQGLCVSISGSCFCLNSVSSVVCHAISGFSMNKSVMSFSSAGKVDEGICGRARTLIEL